MNNFKNIMHFIFTFSAEVHVVPNMSHWGDFKDIMRPNTFWSTISYNIEKILK